MASAASGGHLEVVKYCWTQRCPWNEYTTELAAEGGHLEVSRLIAVSFFRRVAVFGVSGPTVFFFGGGVAPPPPSCRRVCLEDKLNANGCWER